MLLGIFTRNNIKWGGIDNGGGGGGSGGWRWYCMNAVKISGMVTRWHFVFVHTLNRIIYIYMNEWVARAEDGCHSIGSPAPIPRHFLSVLFCFAAFRIPTELCCVVWWLLWRGLGASISLVLSELLNRRLCVGGGCACVWLCVWQRAKERRVELRRASRRQSTQKRAECETDASAIDKKKTESERTNERRTVEISRKMYKADWADGEHNAKNMCVYNGNRECCKSWRQLLPQPPPPPCHPVPEIHSISVWIERIIF